MISGREIIIKNWSESIDRIATLHPNHRYVRMLFTHYFKTEPILLSESDRDIVIKKMALTISRWEDMSDEDFRTAKDNNTGCYACFGFHNFPESRPSEDTIEDYGNIQVRKRGVNESVDGSMIEVKYIVYYFEDGRWVEKGESPKEDYE